MAVRLEFYIEAGPAKDTRRARFTAIWQLAWVFPKIGVSYLMTAVVEPAFKCKMAASFAAFMADSGAGVTAETIITYLSHVRSWHAERRHPDPWPNGMHLAYLEDPRRPSPRTCCGSSCDPFSSPA